MRSWATYRPSSTDSLSNGRRLPLPLDSPFSLDPPQDSCAKLPPRLDHRRLWPSAGTSTTTSSPICPRLLYTQTRGRRAGRNTSCRDRPRRRTLQGRAHRLPLCLRTCPAAISLWFAYRSAALNTTSASMNHAGRGHTTRTNTKLVPLICRLLPRGRQ